MFKAKLKLKKQEIRQQEKETRNERKILQQDKLKVLRLARYIGITALESKKDRHTTDSTVIRRYIGTGGVLEITRSSKYAHWHVHYWPASMRAATVYMPLSPFAKVRKLGKIVKRRIALLGGLGKRIKP